MTPEQIMENLLLVCKDKFGVEAFQRIEGEMIPLLEDLVSEMVGSGVVALYDYLPTRGGVRAVVMPTEKTSITASDRLRGDVNAFLDLVKEEVVPPKHKRPLTDYRVAEDLYKQAVEAHSDYYWKYYTWDHEHDGPFLKPPISLDPMGKLMSDEVSTAMELLHEAIAELYRCGAWKAMR